MREELEVILVQKLEYQRIDCVCGVAVMPIDPTPEVTNAIKKIARECGARFRLVDTTVHPEVVRTYHINTLPDVVIGKTAYPADVTVIKNVCANITG